MVAVKLAELTKKDDGLWVAIAFWSQEPWLTFPGQGVDRDPVEAVNKAIDQARRAAGGR